MTYKPDDYVVKAVGEIDETSDLDPAELLAELPKVIASLRADSPATRQFFAHIREHHRPRVKFHWDVERQAVCLQEVTKR